jgi:GT2 family glycosyltransferase
MKCKLTVIIVSYNVKEKLRDNLSVLLKSKTNFEFEIFVVDNDSKDGSSDMVKNEFPNVKLIENDENLGFAKANNQAIKQADSEFILLLNPDMRVMPDTLQNMITWMEAEPWVSVAGCKLVDEGGNIIKHVRRFPNVWNQLVIVLKIPHVYPRSLDRYLRKDFDYDKPAMVDSIRGGFMMIRRSLIDKIGVLDERYFLWFEEVDYCKTAGMIKNDQPAGEVWYTPAAVCVDYVGQSFKQLSRAQAQKHFRDSMLKYFKKWHPGWRYWLLRSAWPLGILMARAGEKTNIRSKRRIT